MEKGKIKKEIIKAAEIPSQKPEEKELFKYLAQADSFIISAWIQKENRCSISI
jgi:hypothetical protein